MNLIRTDSFGRIVSRLTSSLDNYQDYPDFIPIEDQNLSATHYINGVFLTQPPKPDDAHEWDEVSFSWVYSDKALSEVKDTAIRQIIGLQNIAKSSGFSAFGKIFDSDPTSIQNITNAALAASFAIATNQPFSIDWTTKDNSILTLNAQQFLELPNIITARNNILHIKAQQYKASIRAASTLNEITSILNSVSFDT